MNSTTRRNFIRSVGGIAVALMVPYRTNAGLKPEGVYVHAENQSEAIKYGAIYLNGCPVDHRLVVEVNTSEGWLRTCYLDENGKLAWNPETFKLFTQYLYGDVKIQNLITRQLV